MMRSVFWPFRGVGLAVAAACLASGLAEAQTTAPKPKKDATAAAKPGKKDEAAKPNLVGTYGDWNVFVGQAGKGRICYTLAQPKTREPASLKRDPGYAFISDRPQEGVRNEVSFIMGFDIAGGEEKAEAKADSKSDAKPGMKAEAKPDAKSKSSVPTPVASVEDETFELLPKGGDLWVKNAARESLLIAAMRKGSKLVIKAASLRGHQSIDTYSLAGFAQALDQLQKECPGK
jgi:invasion protein IalB